MGYIKPIVERVIRVIGYMRVPTPEELPQQKQSVSYNNNIITIVSYYNNNEINNSLRSRVRPQASCGSLGALTGNQWTRAKSSSDPSLSLEKQTNFYYKAQQPLLSNYFYLIGPTASRYYNIILYTL